MSISKEDLERKGLVEISPGFWGRKEQPKKAKHKYGAQKVVAEGEKFDSKIEYFFFQLLTYEKIPFVQKKKYVLEHGFNYGNEKIKPIEIIPDFSITNEGGLLIAIVDTKGVETKDWKIKWKLLKKKLSDLNTSIPLFTPHNRAECHQVITDLRNLLGRQ